MKFEIASCAAFTAGLTLLASVARAQPVFITYDSLELRVARAESIVRGTISKCTGVVLVPPEDKRLADGRMRYTVTVKVDEVIKGKAAKTLELFQETSAYDKRFEQWAENHTSFLFFKVAPTSQSPLWTWSNLLGTDAQSNLWNTVRLDEPVPAESGWSADSPIYSMDFVRVVSPKDLLARVRLAAKNRVDPSDKHVFKAIYSKETGRNPFESLAAPINGDLETLAKRMIQSPDEFAPSNMGWTPTNAEQRATYNEGFEAARSGVIADGIRAIQYFKSARNTQLLKPLVNHPASFVLRDETGRESREYYIRIAAFDALQKWNVDVPTPILRVLVRPGLRFVSVDSQETNGENGAGANAVDGKPGTLWHTQWQGASPGYPHEIVVELVPAFSIKGLTCLPRQDDSDHGTIKGYEVYTSDDNESFGQPIAKGTFEPGKSQKTVPFAPVKCRYVKLRAISEINDLAWASAAEIGVIPDDDEADDRQAASTAIATNRVGPPTPLREALAKLNKKVPELSNTSIGIGAPYETNTLCATYTISGGSTVTIIARTYDSEAAARAGQEQDAAMVSVYWDKEEVIQGVHVYQYARYGGLYFQVGCYTLRLETNRRGGEEMQPLLLKISSALIRDLAPAAAGQPAAAKVRESASEVETQRIYDLGGREL